MTGILADTAAVARLPHAHGALSFWDYAAAGPYLPIREAASGPGPGQYLNDPVAREEGGTAPSSSPSGLAWSSP